MSEWPRPNKVYFIGTKDRSLIKIGASSMPEERLDTLWCWSPLPLELLAIAPGSYAEEFALHRYFAAQHSHREWYFASVELLTCIEETKLTKAIPARFASVTTGAIPNRRNRKWLNPDRFSPSGPTDDHPSERVAS